MKRRLFNKKGQSGGSEEVSIGMPVAIISILILLFVSGAFYGWAFIEQMDSASLNSYNLLADGVGRVWQNAGQAEEEPTKISSDLILVAFGVDEKVKKKECAGVEIIKPDKCKKNACLCLCYNTGNSDMCMVKKAECKGYGGNFDFTSSKCNVIYGSSSPLFVEVGQDGVGAYLEKIA
jgi:hypothetical protein